jgi:hypothetical protein
MRGALHSPVRLPFDKLRVAQGPVEMTAFVVLDGSR